MSDEKCTKPHLHPWQLETALGLLLNGSMAKLKAVNDGLREGGICESDYVTIALNYAANMVKTAVIIAVTAEDEQRDEVYFYRSIIEAAGKMLNINAEVASDNEREMIEKMRVKSAHIH